MVPDPTAGESMEDRAGSPELFMFLASTVHDMKNSISVLTGTLEHLLVQGGDAAQDNPAYPQMAQMLYQTKRLNDHLIQLLALYKEVGRPAYPFDPAPVQVSELVDQLASQQRVLLQSKGIRLDTEYPADLIWTFDEDLVLGLLAHAVNATRATASPSPSANRTAIWKCGWKTTAWVSRRRCCKRASWSARASIS
jgi:signal transduction histidine kinase